MAGRLRFLDRADAGRVLAAERQLHQRHPGRDPVVLALPRGGVPVAAPVAEALGVGLAVLVVRKLGAPGQPELAVGAIATLGDHVVRVTNDDVVRQIGLDEDGLRAIAAAETRELEARVAIFGSAPDVTGRTVIVVDDGLATGATMRAAVGAVREAGAAYVMAAAPVGAPGACRELERLADLVVCPRRPDPFRAVGEHYRDFAQVSDDEVLALLGR